MIFKDYEILGTCSNNGIHTTIYKARNTLSNELHMLHVFDYTNKLVDSNKEVIIRKINKRKLCNHPNLLHLSDVIDNEENKTLCIVTEYCSHGNLYDVIDNCKKECKYLEEAAIYKIIFQFLCAMKTIIGKYSVGQLNMSEIFLDSDLNVKLLNFEILSNNNNQRSSIKITQLGMIIYHLCTLKPHEKLQEESELKKLQLYYSSEFFSFLNNTLKDCNNLYKNIDKILCNPSMLLKCSQWKRDKCFFTLNTEKDNKANDQINNSETYLLKLQNLRAREAALQMREQKLHEKEHILSKREKKLILMERIIKEKLSRAELYLKRCRESKSISSGSNKSSLTNKKPICGDTSFSADCGDSIVITSKKLNTDFINKPTAFIRSKSERRVKFKGHSPLKDIDYNARKSLIRGGTKKKLLTLKDLPENIICLDKLNLHENIEPRFSENTIKQTSRELFTQQNGGKENKVLIKHDKTEGNKNNTCYPISWTSENKKYAFDLLRIINHSTNITNYQKEMKHTYL